MKELLGFLAAVIAGALSGMGISGGSLLLLYLSATGWEQKAAQGLNLLYFLPAAGAALWGHIRHRLVDWQTVWPAAATGLAAGGVCAFFVQTLDTELLRKLFGGFLLALGGMTLLASCKKHKEK